jgi:hypothetical protein
MAKFKDLDLRLNSGEKTIFGDGLEASFTYTTISGYNTPSGVIGVTPIDEFVVSVPIAGEQATKPYHLVRYDQLADAMSEVNPLDWQESVINFATAPPVASGTGERWLVAETGTSGDFVGHENEIATWNGTAWVFTPPNEGFTLRVEELNEFYTYDGAEWGLFAATVDHSALSGLDGDDHEQYILVDGSRGFTGTVSGVTPVDDSDLATKGYIDDIVTGLTGGEGAVVTISGNQTITGDKVFDNNLTTFLGDVFFDGINITMSGTTLNTQSNATFNFDSTSTTNNAGTTNYQSTAEVNYESGSEINHESGSEENHESGSTDTYHPGSELTFSGTNIDVATGTTVNFEDGSTVTHEDGSTDTYELGSELVHESGSNETHESGSNDTYDAGSTLTINGDATVSSGTLTFGNGSEIVHENGSTETYENGSETIHESGSNDTYNDGANLTFSGSNITSDGDTTWNFNDDSVINYNDNTVVTFASGTQNIYEGGSTTVFEDNSVVTYSGAEVTYEGDSNITYGGDTTTTYEDNSVINNNGDTFYGDTSNTTFVDGSTVTFSGTTVFESTPVFNEGLTIASGTTLNLEGVTVSGTFINPNQKWGRVAVIDNARSQAVTFDTPWADDDYVVVATLTNEVDATPSIYSTIQGVKTGAGFTTHFSGKIDSGDFMLEWIAFYGQQS